MFLEELLSKENFNLITNSYIDPSLKIDFNTPIMFQIASNNGYIEYDERLFNFKILLEQYEYTNENGSQKQKYIPSYLNFDKCDKVLQNSSFYDDMKEFNLSQLYCINLDQNVTVEGIQGNAGFNSSDFRIYVNRCSNKTKKEHDCYDLEEINTKVRKIHI